MSTAAIYRTSAIKRSRRTRRQVEELENAIHAVAAAEKPVTIRGLFYRVVSKGLVSKTEQGYRQVQNRVLLMRRRGDLPYGWVADGTRWQVKPKTYSSIDRALQNTATCYRRALWDRQNVHVEVWAEKDAIRSVIHPVTDEFDVPLMVARGFASETFLWETAQEIIADDKPAVIYQLGDHDPSGLAAWKHIQGRLTEFAPRAEFQFERLAVTPAQITEHRLPTRPTKTTDSRAADFDGDSVEVDALPSPILRDLVREAIEFWIDDEALRLTEIAERCEREVLYSIASWSRSGSWSWLDREPES